MSHETHGVLIVEDDPATADRLASYVASLGMRARVAMTLEEVDRAIAEGGFCCVLLDKQMPVATGAAAFTATGDTALARLRAYDPRRNADDHHLLGIIIVTGVSQSDTFINDNFRRGATAFVAKPADPDRIATEIQGALERAGRRDHAVCSGLEAARAADPRATSRPPPAESIPIVLDGLRIRRRTSFLVAGKRRDLPESYFLVLLRLAAPRSRGSDHPVSKVDLGILRSPEIPSRIRDEVASALPPDFTLIQRVDEGMFRLHPLVHVAPIDWKVFERHGHPGISAFAAAQQKLR